MGVSWIPCIVSNIAIQVSGGMGYDELTLCKARHLQRNLLAKEVLLERGLGSLLLSINNFLYSQLTECI